MTDNPFEKVLDRLREKGWCKGEVGGRNGPNCLLGAEVMLGLWTNPYKYVMPFIKSEYPDRGEMISAFNNHPDTTFEDIERVLEKAAIKWEEERVTR